LPCPCQGSLTSIFSAPLRWRSQILKSRSLHPSSNSQLLTFSHFLSPETRSPPSTTHAQNAHSTPIPLPPLPPPHHNISPLSKPLPQPHRLPDHLHLPQLPPTHLLRPLDPRRRFRLPLISIPTTKQLPHNTAPNMRNGFTLTGQRIPPTHVRKRRSGCRTTTMICVRLSTVLRLWRLFVRVLMLEVEEWRAVCR
jgi:hypothetical protein